MSTLANNEDPDETQHDTAFHQFAKAKMIFRERNSLLHVFGNLNFDPWIYIMDHPKFIVSSQKEESITKQRV